jgi:hypothetical protein
MFSSNQYNLFQKYKQKLVTKVTYLYLIDCDVIVLVSKGKNVYVTILALQRGHWKIWNCKCEIEESKCMRKLKTSTWDKWYS